MTFSFAARITRGASRARLLLHACRRTVILVALGLLVNGFPTYHLHSLPLPGILQHIALCYLAASLLYLALSKAASQRRMLLIAAAAVAALALH